MRRSIALTWLCSCGTTGSTLSPNFCDSQPDALYCLDFDHAGQEQSPFGWDELPTTNDPNVSIGLVTVGDNRSFAISGKADALGATPAFGLVPPQAVTLAAAFHVESPYDQVAALAEMELMGTNGERAEVLVQIVGHKDQELLLSVSAQNQGFVPATYFASRSIPIGAWFSVALHLHFDGDGLHMSLDEGLPGKAQEVLADTLFTLTFSPVQMTGGAGLRTGVFAPATIYIDDVLMTTP